MKANIDIEKNKYKITFKNFQKSDFYVIFTNFNTMQNFVNILYTLKQKSQPTIYVIFFKIYNIILVFVNKKINTYFPQNHFYYLEMISELIKSSNKQ